jgi:hypothetical protein
VCGCRCAGADRDDVVPFAFVLQIPMPLAHNHPHKAIDLWAQPMRYETQVRAASLPK